jgi:hypothetical protein
MYLDLINDDIRFLRKYLLILKIPLKIKIYVVPEQQNFANNKQFDKEEVEQMQKMLFL